MSNGYTGLIPVNLSNAGLTATPTTSGQLYLNLPSTSTPALRRLRFALEQSSIWLHPRTKRRWLRLRRSWQSSHAGRLSYQYRSGHQWPGWRNREQLGGRRLQCRGRHQWRVSLHERPAGDADANFDPTTGNLNSASPTSLSIPDPEWEDDVAGHVAIDPARHRPTQY